MEQELQLQQDEDEEEEEMRETGIYTFLRRPAVVYPMVRLCTTHSREYPQAASYTNDTLKVPYKLEFCSSKFTDASTRFY